MNKEERKAYYQAHKEEIKNKKISKKGDYDYCEECAFCGDEKCSKCENHCHCGGCV